MKNKNSLAFSTELQKLIEKYKRKDVPFSILVGILETEKFGLLEENEEDNENNEEKDEENNNSLVAGLYHPTTKVGNSE